MGYDTPWPLILMLTRVEYGTPWSHMGWVLSWLCISANDGCHGVEKGLSDETLYDPMRKKIGFGFNFFKSPKFIIF